MVMTSEFSPSVGVCGIYTRISLDTMGEALGVERQRVDGIKVARDNDLDVYRVYTDNSKSAFRRKVKRPGFEALMSDIENGFIDTVVVWKVDRMTRQPMDLERLIEFSESRGLRIITWDSKYDLRVRADRLRLRLEAMVAADQSEAQSDRVKRKHAELRAAGRSVGGRRLYGYHTDGVTRREDEVVAIREMAARLLDGDSLRSIAFSLTEKGYRTAFRDGEWTSQGVRRVVAHPKHATGEPPIFDEDTHRRICQILHDPSRRTSERGVQGKYFLRGLVVCGNCEAPMKGHPQKDRIHYACVSEPKRKACGTVARMVEPVDEMVSGFVLRFLEQSALDPSQADDNGAQLAVAREELRRLQVRQAKLEEQWQDEAVSDDQFDRMNRKLLDRLKVVEAELGQLLASAVVPVEFVRPDIRSVWPTLDPETQRAAVTSVVESVVIHSQGRGYRRKFDPNDKWPQFDPAKVEIRMKAAPGQV